VDRGEADDKIVAVLRGDPIYGDIGEMHDVPRPLVDRLVHYFSTYKRHREEEHEVSVGEPYGRVHAEAVITAAMADYAREFPTSASPELCPTPATSFAREREPKPHDAWCVAAPPAPL